jgi:hypothetical protein
MELVLMKTHCPKCGGTTFMRGCYVNGVEITESPDIPWINEDDPEKNAKCFDMCVHNHHFNIRPLVDQDLHYIYEDKLDEAEIITRERLFAILKLKDGAHGNIKDLHKAAKERVPIKTEQRNAVKHTRRRGDSDT